MRAILTRLATPAHAIDCANSRAKSFGSAVLTFGCANNRSSWLRALIKAVIVLHVGGSATACMRSRPSLAVYVETTMPRRHSTVEYATAPDAYAMVQEKKDGAVKVLFKP